VIRPLAAGLTLGFSSAAVAQSSNGTAPPPRKEAVAVRADASPPVIDGRLDDVAWRSARFFSDFVQKQPVEGAAPTERTEVAFLYDDQALYVAARNHVADPSTIQAFVTRRDNTSQSQHLWISLDTYLDGRTAYSFGVTASGVRMDWYHPTDNEYDIDDDFDPVWEARARVDSLGWTAEMRIPFSQLRFNDRPVQTWGLNVDRWIPEKNEDNFWIPVPTSVRAWSSHMGRLTGIEGIRPPRRLELLPYATGGVTLRDDPDPANPFEGATSSTARMGGDLKMGLGPNFTLDATVNPDFGQVEADPAVVNLSAFEVFFDERRPFFIEGSQLLNNAGGFFYSRRIGARPPGDPGGDYARVPNTSTILGAAKLTGRTGGGLSVAAMGAVTAREHARTFDQASGTFGSAEVAAPTGFAVTRLQQEFGSAASTAGLVLTGVARDVEAGTGLSAVQNRSAVTGAGDWNLRFEGGKYELFGRLGFSRVEGDTSNIARLQRSSARYFQRPDATHVRYDPTRTSLTGYFGVLEIAKRSGKHWLWSFEGSFETPGFEINDMGRLSTADGIVAFGSVSYRETQPKGWLQNYAIQLTTENELNTDWDRQFGALRTDVNLTFRNFWQATITAWQDLRAQDQRMTRGGPSMATPAQRVGIVRLSKGFAARTRWNGRVYYGRREDGGLTYRLSGGLSVRPAPRWSVSVDPNYLRSIDHQQYVTELPGGPAATFGRRYVFATIDQSTWLAQIRFNYTIKPDLTVDLYAEPFAASGRFYDQGELAAPRALGLRRYGTDGSSIVRETDGSFTVTDGADTFSLPALDFNVRSLRSNLVLRWEWRPGSTLYVVWQQDRSSSSSLGDLVKPLSLFDGIAASGNNFLAIKLSYWLPAN
jgi:hypothetical protein